MGDTLAKPAVWLRATAKRINNHPREHAGHILAIGRLLLQVKALLGHGRIISWHNAYLRLRYRESAEAMQLAHLVDKQKLDSATLHHFGVSAVRVLVQRMSKTKRERIFSAPRQAKLIGCSAVQLLTLAESDDDVVACLQPCEPAVENEAWRRLSALLENAEVLWIDVMRDEDAKLKSPEAVTVSIISKGKQFRFCRPDIERALKAAVGEEMLRECPKCRADGRPFLKPEYDFAKSTSWCRSCERERVAIADKKDREKRHGSIDSA